MDSDFIALVPALVGAIGGSFGGIFISDLLKRRNERENVRKKITSKYLIQLFNALQSLHEKLEIKEWRGGSEIKSNDEYNIVSTLYTFGTVFSYDRVMLFEGAYAQMYELYGTYALNLQNQFLILGHCLEDHFLRYDRIALADALTVTENGNLRISSYLDFKQRYATDSQFKLSLEGAREFVVEKLHRVRLEKDGYELYKVINDMANLVAEKVPHFIYVPA